MTPDHEELRLLLIYDNPLERAYLRSILDRIQTWSFTLREESNPTDGKIHLLEHSIDVVILNYSSDENGDVNRDRLEYFRELRSAHGDLPLIAVTSHGNEPLGSRVLRNGIDDYRTFGEITPTELTESIRHSIRVRNEKTHTKQPPFGNHDTGLANQDQTMTNIRDEMKDAIRHRRRFFVALLDLDNFGDLNDEHGKAAGDAVLEQVGRIVGHSIRAGDTAGSHGSDTFLVLLADTDEEGAKSTVERILKEIRSTEFEVPGQTTEPARVTASAGLSEFRGSDFRNSKSLDDLTGLLEQAEQSLQLAKRNGGDRLERRRYERISVGTVPIRIAYGSSRHDAELIDYSSHGIQLRFSPLEDYEDEITVFFETTRNSHLERTGTIEWSVRSSETDQVLLGLGIDVPVHELKPMPVEKNQFLQEQ